MAEVPVGNDQKLPVTGATHGLMVNPAEIRRQRDGFYCVTDAIAAFKGCNEKDERVTYRRIRPLLAMIELQLEIKRIAFVRSDGRRGSPIDCLPFGKLPIVLAMIPRERAKKIGTEYPALRTLKRTLLRDAIAKNMIKKQARKECQDCPVDAKKTASFADENGRCNKLCVEHAKAKGTHKTKNTCIDCPEDDKIGAGYRDENCFGEWPEHYKERGWVSRENVAVTHLFKKRFTRKRFPGKRSSYSSFQKKVTVTAFA
eukprot:g37885.t1